MRFAEITALIETSFKNELLELHYFGYSFGSGFAVYRIKGYNIKLVYDGKEDFISVYKTEKHIKYPTDNWTMIYEDSVNHLAEAIQAIQHSLS